MLSRIQMTNFKCFQTLELPCRPINLLCGINGMGKSTVIQAMLVLRQSFEIGELLKGKLVLGGMRADLGTGRDVLFDGADQDSIGFGLSACGVGEPWSLDFNYSEATDELDVVTQNLWDQAHVKIYDTVRSSIDGLVETQRNEVAFRHRMAILAEVDNILELLPDDTSDNFITDTRREMKESVQILESADPRSRKRNDLRNQINDSCKALLNSAMGIKIVPVNWQSTPPFGGNLVYVNAERVGPRKLYPLSVVLAEQGDFGKNSEYSWNYFNRRQADTMDMDDPRRANSEGRRLRDIVDHWLQDISPGAHLQLDEMPAADAIIPGYAFDRPGDVASRPYRATNVGFGLSYVLPVILALMSPPGTLCLIENPESHLHPRGQTKLAELAARASKAGVQVFVETHSDHFMDGVRIAVRDGLINPEDAAFHYFERDGNKAVVTSPQVDSEGRLSHWPAGFFDQHEENLVRLLAPRS